MTLLERVKELEGKPNHDRFTVIAAWLEQAQIPFDVQLYETGKNIIVPEPSGKPYVIISSHFDVVPHSPGANDNGSAIAVCMDIIERLQTKKFEKFEVLVCFFDEEEVGLKGSQTFVTAYGIENLIGVLNLEMVGMGNKFALWNLNQESKGSLLEAFEAAAKRLQKSTRRYDKIVTNSADHMSFRKAGHTDAFSITCLSDKDEEVAYHYYKAQEFEVEKSVLVEIMRQAPIFQHYHQPTDLARYLSEESLKATAEILWETLVQLEG